MAPLGVFLVVVYLFLCGCVALAASNKGRSAGFWFAVSVLTSPILGGIIIACLRPTDEVRAARMIEAGALKKCPYCAELVKREAKVCRYCHKDLVTG